LGFSLQHGHEGNSRTRTARNPGEPALSDRQAMVLRTVVGAFVGEAGPIGSPTLARLLPEALSSASIRNTLAELTRDGLVRKPHPSAGSIPTERGLRVFVDQLLDPQQLAEVERREIAGSFDAPAGDGLMHEASRALSEHTHQLGFVLPPRLGRIVLRHLSLVRLTSDRVLVVLVSRSGVAHRRVLRDDAWGDQAELERVAALLNERIVGHSLLEMRELFAAESRRLRRRAADQAERAVQIGAQALAIEGEYDLVVATRLALLGQNDAADPELLRELFEAVETKDRLVRLLDQVMDADGVRVSFGFESDGSGLERCAIVTAPYGDPGAPLGLLGVLGPNRMNYGRVIALVEYLSRVVSERLAA
jgi:heat-inducible transcriptional repressor